MSINFFIGDEEYDLFSATQLEAFMEEVATKGEFPAILRRTWTEGKLEFSPEEKSLYVSDVREVFDELTRLKDIPLTKYSEYVLDALLTLLHTAIEQEEPIYCGQPAMDTEGEDIDWDAEAEALMADEKQQPNDSTVQVIQAVSEMLKEMKPEPPVVNVTVEAPNVSVQPPSISVNIEKDGRVVTTTKKEVTFERDEKGELKSAVVTEVTEEGDEQ